MYTKTLESEILKTAQMAVGEAIHTNLTGYNMPLQKLCNAVVDEHSNELKAIIEEAFTRTITNKDFKIAVNNAFTHKLARVLVDKMDGALEKRINELRSDPTIKAKMILAVEQAIKDKG